MSSQKIITDHDRWRKGVGGAPAGLAGEADSFAYAGLDLNLAQFSATTFNGSSFSATTFQQAVWSGCTFTGCTFTGCDFHSIAISACTFANCSFKSSTFDQSRFSATRFTQCEWDALTFHGGHWENVQVLDCTGTTIRGDLLTGEHVDFTGSYFEQLEFKNANINS